MIRNYRSYRLITKLKHWIEELRLPFLTATVAPIILGTIIAWVKNCVFNLEYFMLSLIGASFLHLGSNVINDYFDHVSGCDDLNREFIRPFSGGSRIIQRGLLTPIEVRLGALFLYVLGGSIGLYLTWVRGWIVLVFGMIGLLSGLFYTLPLINLVAHGIGEAFVGLNFGVLMTLGAFYVQTQTLSIEPLVASIPVSLFITAVLYLNEFPDYSADKAVGKNTLVVRLGLRRASYGYIVIMTSAYITILLGVIRNLLPIHTLIGFLTVPISLKAIKHTLYNYTNPTDLAPANGLTSLCHFLSSLLLSIGYVIEGLLVY